jgi:hypothetical protein
VSVECRADDSPLVRMHMDVNQHRVMSCTNHTFTGHNSDYGPLSSVCGY